MMRILKAKRGETLVSIIFYSLYMCVPGCKYEIPPVARNQAHFEVYMGSHPSILSSTTLPIGPQYLPVVS